MRLEDVSRSTSARAIGHEHPLAHHLYPRVSLDSRTVLRVMHEVTKDVLFASGFRPADARQWYRQAKEFAIEWFTLNDYKHGLFGFEWGLQLTHVPIRSNGTIRYAKTSKQRYIHVDARQLDAPDWEGFAIVHGSSIGRDSAEAIKSIEHLLRDAGDWSMMKAAFWFEARSSEEQILGWIDHARRRHNQVWQESMLLVVAFLQARTGRKALARRTLNQAIELIRKDLKGRPALPKLIARLEHDFEQARREGFNH